MLDTGESRYINPDIKPPFLAVVPDRFYRSSDGFFLNLTLDTDDGNSFIPKIPLDPPLQKGEVIPPFEKRGWGDLIDSSLIGLRDSPE